MKKKIFVLGPNKCGTSSLHQFFKLNGWKSVHWENGKLALAIASNISIDQNPLIGFEHYDCFSDLFYLDEKLYISPIFLRDKIIEYYPDEIYILNIRNYNDWVNSRQNHIRVNGSITDRLKDIFGPNYNPLMEYRSFKKLKDYGLKFFHIFDLDNPKKYADLTIFLKGVGLKDVKEHNVHFNKTK